MLHYQHVDQKQHGFIGQSWSLLRRRAVQSPQFLGPEQALAAGVDGHGPAQEGGVANEDQAPVLLHIVHPQMIVHEAIARVGNLLCQSGSGLQHRARRSNDMSLFCGWEDMVVAIEGGGKGRLCDVIKGTSDW